MRGLYAVTDVQAGTTADHLALSVAQAILGGAVMVQYRDKVHEPNTRRTLAQALRTVCTAYGIPLIINDDIELASEIGAAGVHVGKSDGTIQHARNVLGPSAIIGASCYNDLKCALAAADAGASYLAFGSFFPSQTKPGAVRANVELLHAARARTTLPLAAIGGINAQNAPALVAAGADLIAVVSGVFAADDVRSAARRFSTIFETNKQPAGLQRP